MTRIILVHETDNDAEPDVFTLEDPRPHREIIKAINTGAEVIDLELDLNASSLEPLRLGLRAVPSRRGRKALQWAISNNPVDTVTVMERQPPVLISARHYDVLFGIADGLSISQIARRMSISTRTGYLYLAELKARFGVQSTAQLAARAMEEGILPPSGEV